MSYSKKFWGKVEKCNHDWDDNYCEFVYCPTPYCSGTEIHCLKCDVFKVECGCHFCDGLSGWPNQRWQKFYRGKNSAVAGFY